MHRPFHWFPMFPASSAFLATLHLVFAGIPALPGQTALLAPPPADPALAETESFIAALVKDSQRHHVLRKADPADPVWQAEIFARDLADDVAQYNAWMLKVIDAYAARGAMAEAALVADQLPGTGYALAHANLAVAQARKGELAAAQHHLLAAQQGLGTAARHDAGRVRSRCAEALFHMRRMAEAEAFMAQIEELERLRLETRLHEDGLMPALSLQQAQNRLACLQAKGVGETQCRFLLACAVQHLADGDVPACLPFLPEIGSMAAMNGLPPAQRVLVDLAKVAWQAGQTGDARKALALFVRCCNAYAEHAEWKAPYLADAAAVLLSWGSKDDARALLNQAELILPKVFVLDAPAAILAVGRERERLDGPAEGDRLVSMAAQAGVGHPHHRARAAAAVQICLYYADHGRPVPESIAGVLNREPNEGIR